MKKIILYGMLLAGGVFTSCQVETAESDSPVDPARLQVTVEPVGSNLPAATRATVDPVLGEEKVNNLYLLFFQHSSSASGTFVRAYNVLSTLESATDIPLGTDVKLAIGNGEGSGLTHSDDYSIVAFANLDNYLGMTPEAFTATLTGKTEAVVLKTLLNLPGAGTTPIVPDNLPMIGRTAKMANQDLVKVKLTRAVARFDVQNTLRAQYEVASVSIYNAAKQVYLLSNQQIPGPNRNYTERYYGNADSRARVTIVPTGAEAGNVTGGLYAFENFQGDPMHCPDSTTALVVGLRSLTETGTVFKPSDGIRYYRIPIAPAESAQNILRNNVYRVSLRGVLEKGPESEGDAVDGQIEVTINNWNLDDEGLVVTDGQSTMAIPSKIVRFGSEAGELTYNIFTVGPGGTLSITKTNLPNGLKASLDGNTLTVTAEDLPGRDERQGTFELGYGGLRGTVTVIQSPEDNLYLTLNRPTLPMFSPAGGAGIVAGGENAIGGDLIQVSASGDWTAKVYNSFVDPGNLNNVGFRINGTKMTWDSATSADGTAPFDVITTGDNPRTSERYSFVVFTLKDDPSYRQVLVLGQDSRAEIRVEPSAVLSNGITFDMAGAPEEAPTARPDKLYELAVDAGTNWSWKLLVGGVEVTTTDLFEVTKLDDEKLYIRAVGTESDRGGLNLGETRNAVLRLTRPGAPARDIALVHEKFEFEVRLKAGSLSEVPTDGVHTNVLHKIYNPGGVDHTAQTQYAPETFTEYVEYEVVFPNTTLEWEAEITSQSHPGNVSTPAHRGFFVEGTGASATKKYDAYTGAGNTKSKTIRIGFDKIYYPLVHFDTPASQNNVPTVTVRVNLRGKPTIYYDFEVKQTPLTAKTPVGNILAYGGTGIRYGNIADGGYYSRNYADALVNGDYFGPSGKVRTPGVASKATHTTTLTVNSAGEASVPTIGYIHAGGTNSTGNYTDTRNGETQYGFKAIERWRNNNEGFVLYCFADSRPYCLTEPQSTLHIIGWTSEGAENDPDTYNTETNSIDKRVMKYLLGGPFGQTSTDNFVFANSTAGDPTPLNANQVATATPNAVVAIKHVGSGNPMTVIDPANRVAFVSESETFMGNAATAVASQTADVQLFMQNFGAIMMNGLMYGSHFYDTLREDFYPAGTSDSEKRLWILGGRDGSGNYPIVDLNPATP